MDRQSRTIGQSTRASRRIVYKRLRRTRRDRKERWPAARGRPSPSFVIDTRRRRRPHNARQKAKRGREGGVGEKERWLLFISNWSNWSRCWWVKLLSFLLLIILLLIVIIIICPFCFSLSGSCCREAPKTKPLNCVLIPSPGNVLPVVTGSKTHRPGGGGGKRRPAISTFLLATTNDSSRR